MGSSWIEDEYGNEVAELAEQYKSKQVSRRSFLKSLGILGLGATSAATILAACSDTSESTTTAGGGAATSTTAGGDGNGAMDPVVGGTLREGYNRDISTHDPLTTNWYDPAYFAIYEAIVSNDPDGETVPQFASDWSVSDDGLTYTFTVPEGKTSHSDHRCGGPGRVLQDHPG